MALFKDANVTLALDILRIWSADDRYRGVEPYVVPVFFKVDGERYGASLRIAHAQVPRPGTTEQPAQGQISLSVDTFRSGVKPIDATVADIQEDNPLLWVPPGNLLKRGSNVGSGEQVVVRDVSFTSDLIPIPFRIDVFGQYVNAVDALRGLLVPLEDELHDTINLVFLGLNEFVAGLVGLDEAFESCPVGSGGTSDFLNDIEAQLEAMIPGTIGGVFVCMENDAFDEGLAKDLRSSVKDEVASVINNTVNALNELNVIPDPERWIDEDAMAGNVASDLTWPVLTDIGISIGAIVAGALAKNVGLGLYGIVTILSWAIGGKDDPIGVVTATFDHSNLGPAGNLTLRSQILVTDDNDDDNRWELSYTLRVNSIA